MSYRLNKINRETGELTVSHYRNPESAMGVADADSDQVYPKWMHPDKWSWTRVTADYNYLIHYCPDDHHK